MQTKIGEFAIETPTFSKVETKIQGGLATVQQRTDTVKATLVMGYQDPTNGVFLNAGDSVLLSGTAGIQPWAKQKFYFGEKEFVLCPYGQVIAFIKEGKGVV